MISGLYTLALQTDHSNGIPPNPNPNPDPDHDPNPNPNPDPDPDPNPDQARLGALEAQGGLASLDRQKVYS